MISDLDPRNRPLLVYQAVYRCAIELFNQIYVTNLSASAHSLVPLKLSVNDGRLDCKVTIKHRYVGNFAGFNLT